mmetsp:Transcript_5488/g.20562  ORF Transcript_5488/g.20562 Transcript_5488/m.20562 type:complete len:225 (+) Transcript_5488:268-942(+)
MRSCQIWQLLRRQILGTIRHWRTLRAHREAIYRLMTRKWITRRNCRAATTGRNVLVKIGEREFVPTMRRVRLLLITSPGHALQQETATIAWRVSPEKGHTYLLQYLQRAYPTTLPPSTIRIINSHRSIFLLHLFPSIPLMHTTTTMAMNPRIQTLTLQLAEKNSISASSCFKAIAILFSTPQMQRQSRRMPSQKSLPHKWIQPMIPFPTLPTKNQFCCLTLAKR